MNQAREINTALCDDMYHTLVNDDTSILDFKQYFNFLLTVKTDYTYRFRISVKNKLFFNKIYNQNYREQSKSVK